jgi:hypothetical protein
MGSANIQLHAHDTRHLVRVLVVLVALGAAACAHGTITAASPGGLSPLSGKVADVTVTSQGIDQERKPVYDKLEGDRTIEQAITSRLVKDGRYDESGETRVSVRIKEFRLRSTGNAFVNGFLAGVDKLEGEVHVRQGEGSDERYVFKLSGSEEWYFKYSASARFRSLANELAEKVGTLFEDSSS